MYRARRALGRVRFFMCGEYGDLNRRPHFHAILFGVTFPDRDPCGTGLFRSKTLEKLWPLGFSSFGNVTYQSAAYVAGYALKKITGPIAETHYQGIDWRSGELVTLTPEFGHMSLKPGIGASWFQKHWQDVYLARDGVVLQGGKKIPAPSYYDTLLSRLDDDLYQSKILERYNNSSAYAADNTPARLATRELAALCTLKSRQL